MGILILGKTECPICQRVINEGDSYYSFPAFVVNVADPIYFFNDETVHQDCLSKHKLGDIAKKYAELYLNAIHPSNRRSAVTGERIIDQLDHIFFGYLTSDDQLPLARFNFLHIAKHDLVKWPFREEAIKELQDLKDSKDWKEKNDSNYLGALIDQLSQ